MARCGLSVSAIVLALCVVSGIATPVFPDALHSVQYQVRRIASVRSAVALQTHDPGGCCTQPGSSNVTSLFYYDTSSSVSRQDFVNYQDSYPQRTMSIFYCKVRWSRLGLHFGGGWGSSFCSLHHYCACMKPEWRDGVVLDHLSAHQCRPEPSCELPHWANGDPLLCLPRHLAPKNRRCSGNRSPSTWCFSGIDMQLQCREAVRALLVCCQVQGRATLPWHQLCGVDNGSVPSEQRRYRIPSPVVLKFPTCEGGRLLSGCA